MHNNANRCTTWLIEETALKIEKIDDSKKDTKCMIAKKCPTMISKKGEKDEKKEEMIEKVIKK